MEAPLLSSFSRFNMGYPDALFESDDRFEKMSNVEKMGFVKNTKAFETRFQQMCVSKKNSKCNKKSDFFREKGNKSYAQRGFVEALEFFNQSICFAHPKSEELGKSYANRSAVYFEMKMYELSVENIRMARNTKYPKQLNDREGKCKAHLNNEKEKKKQSFSGLEPKLSYPEHYSTPFIADILDIKSIFLTGQYVAASQRLKVGDIVAIEKPFSGCASRHIQYICCANCLSENDLNLIPCIDCALAMFCSAECMAKAKQKFHDIECPILGILLGPGSADFAVNNLMSPYTLHEDFPNVIIRLLIQAVKMFNSVEELVQFNQIIKDQDEVFHVEKNGNQDIGLLASILKLADQADLNHDNIQVVTMTSALCYQVLMDFTQINDIFKSDAHLEFLKNLIFQLHRLMITVPCVITDVKAFAWKTDRNITELELTAIGIYPFRNLLLCDKADEPNVVQIKYGVLNLTTVIRPIKSLAPVFEHYDLFTYRLGRTKESYVMGTYSVGNNTLIRPAAHMKLCREYNIEAVKDLIVKYRKFVGEEFFFRFLPEDCRSPNLTEKFCLDTLPKDLGYIRNDREYIFARILLLELLKVAYTDEIPLFRKMNLPFK